ncbi:MAG: hypothetical protein GF329_19035 [Candidatus Lokiarchaeota archaeon]|nr:hypothetical protein [Candidatus Lokiarchaeota archaeon]
MIELDNKKVKEAVDEIEQSEYFQNVLSQVRKIRAIKKDKNLKENSDKWRQKLANYEFNKLNHYLKEFYDFKSPKNSPEYFPKLFEYKKSQLKRIKRDNFDPFNERNLINQLKLIKLDIIDCSELSVKNT